MILCTITTDPRVHPERFESFGTLVPTAVYVNQPNIGVVPVMQKIYEAYMDVDKFIDRLRDKVDQGSYDGKEEDIICYVHDDVTCYDSKWSERVRAEFDDPKVAVVGFGGATGIGVDDIYKTRYQIEQLQRIGYASNAREWETHGSYEAGSKDVAVVDGFFMAVRTSFLKEIGGFKWMPMKFHCYDTALCLLAHRRGYKVRMVGIECTHHGASYSASPEYKKWCLENGTTMEREHSEPHRWMYDFFRPELPLRV